MRRRAHGTRHGGVGSWDARHIVNAEAGPRTVTSEGQRERRDEVAPLLEGLFGDHMPVRFEFWDGSGTGPTDGPGALLVRSPDAISRMLWAPGELGIGRAYVSGELEDGRSGMPPTRDTWV